MNSDKWYRDKSNLKLSAIILTAILIVGVFWSWNYHSFNNIDNSPQGEFGDKFGVVNALFSGLAFAGIIITIYLQMSELKEQRKELQMTRGTFEKQLFESTFFEMLKIHNQNVQEFSYNGKLGKEGFKLALTAYKTLYEKTNDNINHLVGVEQKLELFSPRKYQMIIYYMFYRGIGVHFEVWLKKYGIPTIGFYSKAVSKDGMNEMYFHPNNKSVQGVEHLLSSYYRHMFQLVKYVHDAEDSMFLPLDLEGLSEAEIKKKVKEKKYQYIKNLRSQLSLDQQAMFAINALSEFGKEWTHYNGVNLIEVYQLIKNLHFNYLNDLNVDLRKEFPNVNFYG